MDYQVKVRRQPISGMAADGARLNILKGTYDVVHDGRSLIFKGADTRNHGDIIVSLDDYPEISDFPDINYGLQIEIVAPC